MKSAGQSAGLCIAWVALTWVGAQTARAVTPEAAVTAARATPAPDWSALRQSPDALSAIASMTGDTQAIEALRENGQGVLFAPGRRDADACHDQTDPRCRAVQVVDRLAHVPNPVDPDLSGELMAGRDDVVASADERVDLTDGVTSSTGTCRPITSTVTVPAQTHTCEIRTVRTPGESTQKRCEERWMAILDEASRWACSIAWFTQREMTCSVPVRVPQDRTQTFACYEGVKEPDLKTCPVTVTHATRDRWTAVCTEPHYVVRRRTCTKERVVAAQATCTPGQAVEASVVDTATLAEDGVTGLDRLRLRYVCAQETGRPKIEIAVNASGTEWSETVATREATFDFSRTVHGDTWRAAGETACDAAGACTSRVTLSVYKGTGTDHVLTGTLTCVLAFDRFAITREEDRWIERCTEATP